MLEISLIPDTGWAIAYALSGEITDDQLARIEAIVESALARGRPITLDVQHVWRVDRAAGLLIARHACRPNNRVRIVGVGPELLGWLRTVAQDGSGSGVAVEKENYP